MKKGISITLHTITFVLLGLTIAVTILMYFNNKNKYEEYNKEIEELKETNKSLKEDLNKYSTSSKNENHNQENNEQNNEEESTYDISKFDKIKASDIAKISKGETIVIMMGREGCGWCSRYIPVLKSAQEKYDFTTKYLDLATMIDSKTWELIDQESYNILTSLPAEAGYENFIKEEFGATPLTFIIKDNKIINAFAGYVEESYLSSVLEECGFSK